MNQLPIFFEPIFKERIWGGTVLRDQFGYDIPTEKTGECWAISAHLNGPSIVKSDPWKGMTLEMLWKNHRKLFGGLEGENFPLLTMLFHFESNSIARRYAISSNLSSSFRSIGWSAASN